MIMLNTKDLAIGGGNPGDFIFSEMRIDEKYIVMHIKL